MSSQMGAGNGTQGLCKSSRCSEMLIHLFRPYLCLFYSFTRMGLFLSSPDKICLLVYSKREIKILMNTNLKVV